MVIDTEKTYTIKMDDREVVNLAEYLGTLLSVTKNLPGPTFADDRTAEAWTAVNRFKDELYSASVE